MTFKHVLDIVLHFGHGDFADREIEGLIWGVARVCSNFLFIEHAHVFWIESGIFFDESLAEVYVVKYVARIALQLISIQLRNSHLMPSLVSQELA